MKGEASVIDDVPAAGNGVGTREPGRFGAEAKFVDEVGGQPREARVGIGRGRPCERHPGFLGLDAQLVVEIPHHLDVVGDEPDRADDDGLGAGLGEGGDVVGHVRFQPRHLRGARAGLPDHVVVVVPGGCRDKLCGVTHLAAVELWSEAVVGADRHRVRGEDQPGVIGHGVRRGEDVVGEHLVGHEVHGSLVV